ncbi:MAG: hypothetical protein Q9160_008791 [Pyrenula sp. 1 TL-2023]
MGFIHALTNCFTGRSTETHDDPFPSNGKAHQMSYEPYIDEKAPTLAKYHDSPPRTSDDIASSIITILLTAENPGEDLRARLDEEVHPYGWTENIAKAILRGLVNVLMKGAAMGQAMNDACDKAVNAAVEFAKEHPVYATIIALGVLVLLMPWVIEALGFGELGPIEGMFHPILAVL